jgi:hypothetical protein
MSESIINDAMWEKAGWSRNQRMRVAARWLRRLLPQLSIADVLEVAKVMMEESNAEDEGQRERQFAELLYQVSKNVYRHCVQAFLTR